MSAGPDEYLVGRPQQGQVGLPEAGDDAPGFASLADDAADHSGRRAGPDHYLVPDAGERGQRVPCCGIRMQQARARCGMICGELEYGVTELEPEYDAAVADRDVADPVPVHPVR